ncbi:MAG: hypothetical protein ACI9MR_003364 [Myxococcota bacterium]|jgi:hypothetical protein
MKISIAALVALGLLWVTPNASAQWVNVAPGVDRKSETIAGPRRIRALRVDLCQPGVRLRATTYAERGKRTSTWAAARDVVAATNGGYFLSGSWAPDAGAAWGDGDAWPTSTESGVRGWIGFGPRRWEHSPAPEVRNPGSWADEVINGDATLVRDGNVVNCGGCGSGRAPRTAIGMTADGRTLYLVVVDGRTSSSIGMTIDQLAAHMGTYGVHTAMNLDGGGSSTMWIKGVGVVNVPSDGSQRTVGNHLGVYASGAGVATHCPTGYAAEYVGSSFPGGLTLTLEPNATAAGFLEFRNVGGAVWSNLTRLAPLPKDQASAIAHGSWLSPSRVGVPTGDVGANQIGRFAFTVQAPATVGPYTMQLDMVQEFVTWFSDGDGPPIGELATMTVNVVNRPDWRAELVGVGGFPGNSTTITAETGAVLGGWIDLKNTGGQTWPAGIVKLGTTSPRDHASALQAASWLTPGRIAANAAPVAPDQTVRYAFDVRVPDSAGQHIDRFGLLAEAVTWFSDDGGPADDFLTFTLTAVAPQPDPDPEPDVDTSEPADTSVPDTEIVDPPDIIDTRLDDTNPGDDAAQDSVVAETVVTDTVTAEVIVKDSEAPQADAAADTLLSPETARVARQSQASRRTLDDGCGAAQPGSDVPWLLLLGLFFACKQRRRLTETA